jgi:hypothetical protein
MYLGHNPECSEHKRSNGFDWTTKGKYWVVTQWWLNGCLIVCVIYEPCFTKDIMWPKFKCWTACLGMIRKSLN